MKKKLVSIILSIITIAVLMPAAYAFPEPDWGALLKEREAMVNETDFDLYVEGSIENAPYYGAKFEPRGGAYIGMLASAAESYKPLGSYLTYVESYWQNDLYVPDNNMVKNDNVITMVGWTVGDVYSVDYDGVRHMLEKLNSYGKPMLIRFANEMNVSSIGDDPEQYVSVFRNVANMIHEYPNLGVVWSPNDIGALDRPFELYYPGDEYVDWVGVSCYTTQYFLGNANTSYNDSVYFITGDYGFATNKVKPVIKFMQDNGINKPVMISEGGVATNASAEWNTPRMRNMMYSLIMKYPQIKMINYFNVRMKNESEWFDITDHQSPSDIFKEAASSGAYIRNYGDSPRFAFSKADIGDTLVADANGIVNLYTLAYIPKNPDVNVTYKVDGTWYHEAHEMPYKCGLNVNGLADGEHTITIEGAGQSKSYNFIKRNDRIRFGGEPDMSKTSNIPKDKSKGNDIRVFVKKNDGNTLEIKFYEQFPVIVDGSTLVPLRNIFEGMDIPVEWNGDTQTVKWDTCTMEIGSSSIEKLVEISYGKNNSHRTTVKETIDLAVPAQIMNGRTMVPLRAIAECTGYTVDWDENARTVTINM
ncbi:MAG: stalk domain-containing protein [Hominilimicola sp.]